MKYFLCSLTLLLTACVPQQTPEQARRDVFETCIGYAKPASADVIRECDRIAGEQLKVMPNE